jgi:hypothetical protein
MATFVGTCPPRGSSAEARSRPQRGAQRDSSIDAGKTLGVVAAVVAVAGPGAARRRADGLQRRPGSCTDHSEPEEQRGQCGHGPPGTVPLRCRGSSRGHQRTSSAPRNAQASVHSRASAVRSAVARSCAGVGRWLPAGRSSVARIRQTADDHTSSHVGIADPFQDVAGDCAGRSASSGGSSSRYCAAYAAATRSSVSVRSRRPLPSAWCRRVAVSSFVVRRAHARRHGWLCPGAHRTPRGGGSGPVQRDRLG